MLRGGRNEHPAMVAKQEALNKRSWRQFWRGCRGARLDVDVAAVYDEQAVFYYPERLYMGLWLSAWLQVLLAAVVFSMAAWADGVVLYAQQKATQTLENAASASLGDAGTSPVELAFNLHIAEAGKYLAVYIATIQAIFGEGFLRPFAIAIGAIQLGYVLSLWRGIFVRYRARLLRMRRGDYFFKREEFRESGSSMFIGYQVAFIAVVSIIFFWVAVGLVCLFAVVFIAAKGVLVGLVIGVDVPEGAKDFDDPFFDDFGPVSAAAQHLHTEEYPVHSSGSHRSSSGLAYFSSLLAGAAAALPAVHEQGRLLRLGRRPAQRRLRQRLGALPLLVRHLRDGHDRAQLPHRLLHAHVPPRHELRPQPLLRARARRVHPPRADGLVQVGGGLLHVRRAHPDRPPVHEPREHRLLRRAARDALDQPAAARPAEAAARARQAHRRALLREARRRQGWCGVVAARLAQGGLLRRRLRRQGRGQGQFGRRRHVGVARRPADEARDLRALARVPARAQPLAARAHAARQPGPAPLPLPPALVVRPAARQRPVRALPAEGRAPLLGDRPRPREDARRLRARAQGLACHAEGPAREGAGGRQGLGREGARLPGAGLAGGRRHQGPGARRAARGQGGGRRHRHRRQGRRRRARGRRQAGRRRGQGPAAEDQEAGVSVCVVCVCGLCGPPEG